MKTRMMMIGIAVAALLLCAESVQAQSRVVRRAHTERSDDRLIRKDDPRRSGPEVAPQPKPRKKIKVVDNDVILAFERESFDNDRLRMADMIFSTGGYMNTDQIRKIARIINFDSNRIIFLKKAYMYCIDRHNFYTVLGTLDFSSSRENVIEFVLNCKYDALRDGAPLYKVSNSDMNSILKVLKKESFDSARDKIARMIICGALLTSRQIADMAKTFTFDSNRYEFLLYAFGNCADPQNYYIAVNTLEYSSSRNNLMNAISRR